MKRDVLQVFDTRFESALLIGVPEEASVVEACAKDAFIAVANETGWVARGVHHGGKTRGQGVGSDGEVLLVEAHHRGEHLGGQGEERGVKLAGDDGGELCEIDEGFEERRVVSGIGREFRLNFGTAFFGRKNDAVGAQFLFVVRDGDGEGRFSQTTMAGGLVATCYASEFKRDDLVIEKGDNPANGADETGATFGGPVHGFRPRNFADEFGQLGG